MSKTIKVVTYNINNAKQGENLEDIARFLKSLDADVIAIQEADKGCSRSLNTDMALRIAYVTEMEHRYFPAIGMKDWYWKHTAFYGLAILSRFPIIGENCYELFSKDVEQRILCAIEINIDGENITVYNTHLTYENKEIRTKQLEEIDSIINKKSSFIVCGDFNVDSSDEFLAIKNCDYINTKYNNFETCQDDDYKKIDNIFFSKNLSYIDSCMGGGTISDHNALISNLKINNKE